MFMGEIVDHVPNEGVNTWQSNIIHLFIQPPCLIIQDYMFFLPGFFLYLSRLKQNRIEIAKST